MKNLILIFLTLGVNCFGAIHLIEIVPENGQYRVTTWDKAVKDGTPVQTFLKDEADMDKVDVIAEDSIINAKGTTWSRIYIYFNADGTVSKTDVHNIGPSSNNAVNATADTKDVDGNIVKIDILPSKAKSDCVDLKTLVTSK